MSKIYNLSELADLLGAELHGDPHSSISGLAPLSNASSLELSFLHNSRYKKHLTGSKAGAVILSPADREGYSGNALVMDNPYLGFAKAAVLFSNIPMSQPGIHPSAIVAEDCDIHETASIGPGAILEKGVSVGAHTVIGAGTTLGEDVKVGEHCRLWSNVSVYYRVQIGNHVQVHAGAVIGSDGFGMAKEEGRWLNIPQLGTVLIGDHVDIGASTTIDRGALGDTIIEEGVKLDNQIQVGHNVRIGAHTAIAAGTAIAGSTGIGKHCMISGLVGFSGHFDIADHVVVTGMTKVTKPLTKPGLYSSGTTVEPHAAWRKNVVRFRQLDDMAKRVRELEQQIEQLTKIKEDE